MYVGLRVKMYRCEIFLSPVLEIVPVTVIRKIPIIVKIHSGIHKFII